MSVWRKLSYVLLLLAAGAWFAMAQDQAPQIKKVPAPATSPASGKQMFVAYCASCHGADGKGDGPAASALKTPPADLTMLVQSNGGKFPSMKVSSAW